MKTVIANYVEMEQILQYHHYTLSSVQVRGSIPIYWSQPGYKYRPPKLDESPAKSAAAFRKHFDRKFRVYGNNIHILNLAESNGREKVVSDAFQEQAIAYDDEKLSFISFDVHDYRRGMHLVY